MNNLSLNILIEELLYGGWGWGVGVGGGGGGWGMGVGGMSKA